MNDKVLYSCVNIELIKAVVQLGKTFCKNDAHFCHRFAHRVLYHLYKMQRQQLIYTGFWYCGMVRRHEYRTQDGNFRRYKIIRYTH